MRQTKTAWHVRRTRAGEWLVLVLLLAGLPARWVSAVPPTVPSNLANRHYVVSEIVWVPARGGRALSWVRREGRVLNVYINPDIDQQRRAGSPDLDAVATVRRAARYLGDRLHLSVNFVESREQANVWVGPEDADLRVFHPQFPQMLRQGLALTYVSYLVEFHGPRPLLGYSAVAFNNDTNLMASVDAHLSIRTLEPPEFARFLGREAFQDNLATLGFYFQALHELMHVVGFDHPFPRGRSTPGPGNVFLSPRTYFSQIPSVMGTLFIATDDLTYQYADVTDYFYLLTRQLGRFPTEADIGISDSEVAAFESVNGTPATAPPAAPAPLQPPSPGAGALFCVAGGSSGRAVSGGSSAASVGDTPGTCAAGQQAVTAQVVTLRNLETSSCASPYDAGMGTVYARLGSCSDSTTAASNAQKFVQITYPDEGSWFQLRSVLSGQCLGAVASSDDGSSFYLSLQPCGARSASNKGQAFTSTVNADQKGFSLGSVAYAGVSIGVRLFSGANAQPIMLSSSVRTRWDIVPVGPVLPQVLNANGTGGGTLNWEGGLFTLQSWKWSGECLEMNPDQVLDPAQRGNPGQNALSSCQRRHNGKPFSREVQAIGTQSWWLNGVQVHGDRFEPRGGFFQVKGADGRCLMSQSDLSVVRKGCDANLLSQQWLIVDDGTGLVEMQSADTGLMLATGSSTTVQLQSSQSGGATRWGLQAVQRSADYAAGEYRFTPKHNPNAGMNLAFWVPPRSAPTVSQSAAVKLMGNTLWRVVPREMAQYELHSFKGDYCVTALPGSAGSNPLVMAACDSPDMAGENGQRFYLPGQVKDASGKVIPAAIESVLTGLVVEVGRSSLDNNAQVLLSQGSEGDNQLWSVEAYAGGSLKDGLYWLKLAGQPQLCVDALGTTSGTGVRVDRCSPYPATANQLWRAWTGANLFTLSPFLSPTSCLGVARKQDEDRGVQTVLGECGAQLAHLWKWFDLPGGKAVSGVPLVSQDSGQVLGATSRSAGAAVTQSPWETYDTQWWVLAPAPTDWVDFTGAGSTLPVRFDPATGEVQCAAKAPAVESISNPHTGRMEKKLVKECLWGTQAANLDRARLNPPLSCGSEHYGMFWTDGYSQSGHWCAQVVQYYQSREFAH